MPEPPLLRGVYQVTENARNHFDAGQPGQGFIGIVDTETNKLYLYPGFHKNDGMARVNKNGQELTPDQYVESSVHRGKQTILPAHRKVGTKLFGREECDRKINEGKLQGFGIWKAGIPLLIKNKVDYNSEDKKYTPDEYVLTYDDSSISLNYIDSELRQTPVDISSISDQISKILGDNPEHVSLIKRNEIMKLIYSIDVERKPIIETGTKYFKASSTELNSKSMTYDPLYMCFFLVALDGHLSHAQGMLRELNNDAANIVIESLKAVNIITAVEKKQFVSPTLVLYWHLHAKWYAFSDSKKHETMNLLLATFMNDHPHEIKPLYRFFKAVWQNRTDYQLHNMPNLNILCALSANDSDGLHDALTTINHSQFNLNVPLALITSTDEMKRTFENWVMEIASNATERPLGFETLQLALKSFCTDDTRTNEVRTMLGRISEYPVEASDFQAVLKNAYHARATNNIEIIYEFFRTYLSDFPIPRANHLAMLGKSVELNNYLAENNFSDDVMNGELYDSTLLLCAVKSNDIQTVNIVLGAIRTDAQLTFMLGENSAPELLALHYAIVTENADIYNAILGTYSDIYARDECVCQLLREYLINNKRLPKAYGHHLITMLTKLCDDGNTSNRSKIAIFDTIAELYVLHEKKMQPELSKLLRATLKNHNTAKFAGILHSNYAKALASALQAAVFIEDIPVINIIMHAIPVEFRLNYALSQNEDGCSPIMDCFDRRPINLEVLDSLLSPLDNHSLSLLFSQRYSHNNTLFHFIIECGDIQLLEYVNTHLKAKLANNIPHYLSIDNDQGITPIYMAARNTDNPAILKFLVSTFDLPTSFCYSGTDSLLKDIIYHANNTNSIIMLFDCYQNETDKMDLMLGDPGLIDYIIDCKRYDMLHFFLQEIGEFQPDNMSHVMQHFKSKLTRPNVLHEYVFTDTSLAERAERLTTLSAFIPECKDLLDPFVRQLSNINKPKSSAVVISSTSFQPLSETDITRGITDALIMISDILNRAPKNVGQGNSQTS